MESQSLVLSGLVALLHQFHFFTPYANHAVTHDGRTRVDAQNDSFRRLLGRVGRHASTKVHLEMHFRHFVTAAALGYIAWALTDHSIWSDSAALEALWHPDRPWLLGILVAGLPLNIALETAKWHALTANGDKSWSTSLREVLIGATFAMVTPNRTGDAVARVALLPSAQRSSGTQAWLLGAWAQAGWTLTFGAAAWWTCTRAGQTGLALPEEANWMVFAVLAATSTAWWLLPRLTHYPLRINRWLESRWGLTPGRWSPRQHLVQIALSGLRYAVFASQFAVALAAWGNEWDIEIYTSIAVVYLGNMIVPTAALAELGVREALLVAWMQPPGSLLPGLLAAAFLVWAVNLGIPALIGGGLQFRQHHG